MSVEKVAKIHKKLGGGMSLFFLTLHVTEYLLCLSLVLDKTLSIMCRNRKSGYVDRHSDSYDGHD